MSPEQHRFPLAIGLALAFSACSRPPSIDELLARAYSEERRFEWQLPAQRWSAVAANRKSALERSPALLRAQQLLAQDGDPLLQARADLIEARVEAAMTPLQNAATPDALVDLAVAHGVSADRGGPAAGLAAAVEYTTRALALDPAHRRAVFNRALAFERLNLKQRAASEWRRYVEAESDPAWKREAQEHAARLAKESPARAAKPAESEFVDLLRDPAAARERAAAGPPDRWLSDALAERADPQPLLSVMAANEAGNPNLAASLATTVTYVNAPAHRLRARYELVYAQSRRMDACQPSAAALARDARARRYHWLALLTELTEAACLSMSGPPEVAIAHVRRVEQAAAAQGFTWLADRALSYRSNMQLYAGDLWSTWDDDRRLLAAGRPRHLSVLNYQTAAAQRGWHAAAYEFGLTAAAIAAEIPNRVLEASNRYAAASSALAAGLYADARREAKAAQEVYAQLEQTPERRRYLASLEALQAKALLASGQAAQAIALLEAARRDLQTDDDRLAASETLGLAHLALGQHKQARPELEACVAALRRTAPADRSRRLAAHREAYRGLARILLDAGDPGAALRIWLEAHGSEAAPAIAWLALPDGYAAWSNGQYHRLRVARADIGRLANELARDAASPDSAVPQLRIAGRELFDALVKPLPNWRQPALTLLPDGELSAIPLHLLVTPEGAWWGAQRLLEHAAHPVSATWARPQKLLAFAVGRGPAHLPPLPDSGLEARELRKHWPEASVFTDDEATAAQLRANLAEAELFHFSGHGWASADLGGVHLADSILTPLTLRSTRLPAMKLAVLSACFTAAGTNTGLANPDSLVRALLDAGAGTVLASRWAIDSVATRRWMASFYAQLTQGEPPAVAAQRANEAMEKQFAHPYYWAAFQLYK